MQSLQMWGGRSVVKQNGLICVQILRQDGDTEEKVQCHRKRKVKVIGSKTGTYTRHHLWFIFLNVSWLSSPSVG